MKYGWTWIEGEDDETGNSWIQIGPLEGEYQSEELATIMCRNYEKVKVENPQWIEQKEKDAQRIVDALNLYEMAQETLMQHYSFSKE